MWRVHRNATTIHIYHTTKNCPTQQHSACTHYRKTPHCKTPHCKTRSQGSSVSQRSCASQGSCASKMIAGVTVTGFPSGTTYDHVLNMMRWFGGFLGLIYENDTARIEFESIGHATDAYVKLQSLLYSPGHWLSCKINSDGLKTDNDHANRGTLFVGNLSGKSGEYDELDLLMRSQLGHVYLKYVRKPNTTFAFAQFQTPQHAALARVRLQGCILSTGPGVPIRVRFSKNPLYHMY
jgi:hypothetical protein